ncbi:MAG: hypothetical protein AAF353_17960, partial [Pseudomonadota bacterium]
VDLVLGPLITFLIFDLSKSRREIVFDLIIITTIQFSALFYGVYLTYNQRPVAIVMIDEFVVTAIDEHYGNTLESLDSLVQYSDEKPPIIFSDMPIDEDALAEAHRIKVEEGVLEHAQTQFYLPKSEFLKGLQSRQVQYLTRLDDFGEREYFDRWLEQNQKTADEVMIARFSGRYGKAWLVFDQDGNYQDFFPID